MIEFYKCVINLEAGPEFPNKNTLIVYRKKARLIY